jgi:hypothetical protein
MSTGSAIRMLSGEEVPIRMPSSEGVTGPVYEGE